MWEGHKTAIVHDNKIHRRRIEYVPATAASGKFGSKLNGAKSATNAQVTPEKKSIDDGVSGPKPGLFPAEVVDKHLKWSTPRRLVREVWSKDAPKSISPRGMVQTIRKVGKQFRPMRQEDAHEYLRQLIDCMHEEQLKAGHMKFSTHGKLCETTLMSRLFGGYFRNELRCSCCGYVSRTYNQFLDLSLEVMKNVSSVTDALNGFQRKEVLGKGNEWKCEKCNKKVQATKQMTVHIAPATLVLHLKRFSFGGMFSKVNKHIKFDSTLQLKTSSEPAPVPYDLCGIVVHHGSSVHSGHYVAYVKGAGGQWCCMNDNHVSVTALKQVLQEQAYILFYTKKPPLPQPVPAITKTPLPEIIVKSPVATPPVVAVVTPTISPKIPEPPMETAVSDAVDEIDSDQDSHHTSRLKPRHHFWQPLFRFAGRLNKFRLWRKHRKSLEKPLREVTDEATPQESVKVEKEADGTTSCPSRDQARANEEAAMSLLSELDSIVESKSKKRAGVTVFKEHGEESAVSREDILKLSYRGRDVGTEGYWDDVSSNVTDKLVNANKQQRKAEREILKQRQRDEWDTALDSGRVKKIKVKTEEDSALTGRNFFQEAQDRKGSGSQNDQNGFSGDHRKQNKHKKHNRGVN